MEKIKESMKDKFRKVEELQVTEQGLGKTIMKRKNWPALGIDGISNFWWKTLRLTWGKLATVMQARIEDPNKLPKWLTLRRTVLIPKTEDLPSEQDYRPTMCLKTLYKIFTGRFAQNIKNIAKNQFFRRRNKKEKKTSATFAEKEECFFHCTKKEVFH